MQAQGHFKKKNGAQITFHKVILELFFSFFLAGVSVTLVFDKQFYTENPAILDTLFEKIELIPVLAPMQPVTSKRMNVPLPILLYC